MRQTSLRAQRAYIGFNPRICKRCDVGVFSQCHQGTVSIHASVKDATIGSAYIRARKDVSIHASVKDATKVCVYRFRQLGFNPRICKRCDFFPCIILSILYSFNPRICKRCDDFKYILKMRNRVSIHASVKDATGLR